MVHTYSLFCFENMSFVSMNHNWVRIVMTNTSLKPRDQVLTLSLIHSLIGCDGY